MQDWQIQKNEYIEKAHTLVIKIGSAVLTDKNGVNLPILENISEQIVQLIQKGKRVVLVSSGAVAAGRASLRSFNITENYLEGLSGKQAAAAIGQGKLIHIYDEIFAKHGILSSQILLTRDDFNNRERFLNARNTLMKLLDMGVLPIVNENDTVSVAELKFGDNDALASYLLNAVEGQLFINLTSTNGVLEKNPLTTPKTEKNEIMPCIAEIDKLDIDGLCGGKTSVGSGGMFSKLQSALRAAQLAVPTYILPGKEKDIILKGLDIHTSSAIGTWVSPLKHNISRKKYWLAYRSAPKGSISVDTGAAKALKELGKSLLPAGVIALEGDFKEGDLVQIIHENKAFAVGLINYSALDMQKIAGKKREEVSEILGNAHYLEVIHRDNMLLNAAIS